MNKLFPLFILLFLFGCATMNDPALAGDKTSKEWVSKRSESIESTISELTKGAICNYEKGTFGYGQTIEMMKAIAGNINALVASGEVDPDIIRSTLRIQGSYFYPLTAAITSIIHSELETYRLNGHADLSMSVLVAASRGIMKGLPE